MNEPLDPPKAKALILLILEEGSVVFSKHAKKEMQNDGLVDQDILNILRAGIVEPAETENGRWRYRVRTSRMYAVTSFRSESELVVVTAWRVKK